MGERDYGKYFVRPVKNKKASKMTFLDTEKLDEDFGDGAHLEVDQLLNHGQSVGDQEAADAVQNAEKQLRERGIDPDQLRVGRAKARLVDVNDL